MAFTKKIREQIHAKYGGKCAYCGKDIEYKQMQLDHIHCQNRFVNGETKGILDINNIDNLNPSCRRCNFRKSTFTVEQFREQIALQCQRLKRDSSQYSIAIDYGMITETSKPILFYFETV